MTGLMWLGRLEIIPIVVLALTPLLAQRLDRVALAVDEQHLAELVFLAGLEHREHLVARAEHGRVLGELRAAVAA